MPLPIETVTVLRMGRSREARRQHLADAHDIPLEATLGKTFDQVDAFHRKAHQPDNLDRHRHVGSEWCLACRGRSEFHSCQFQASGTYQVNAGSKNQKACLACANQALRHSCGLAGLQRMLSW